MFLVQPFLIFGISKIGTQGQIGRLHENIYFYNVNVLLIVPLPYSRQSRDPLHYNWRSELFFFSSWKYSEPDLLQALTEWNNNVQFANSLTESSLETVKQLLPMATTAFADSFN